MSGFVKILLQLLFVTFGITAKESYRLFTLNKEVAKFGRIVSCINSTARRLFDSGNRLIIICEDCGPLDNEIARLLMKEDPVIMATKPLDLINERILSYVVIGKKNVTSFRKEFLGENRRFSRFFEYLIIFFATPDSIRNLCQDMWQFGYRHFAFLLFHNHDDYGEIAMPGADNNNKFALEVQKVCTTTNEKNLLTPFSDRICLSDKCVLHYGGVSDETVKFWRSEDKFKTSGLGSRFVQRYGNMYNIATDMNISRNLNWSEATRLLNEDKMDIVNGLTPDNVKKYEGLQILCWYMYRYMVFAAKVQHRNLNEMLQLLMPFHYSVWIFVACLSIFYLSLIHVLKRFWQAGLMSEYIHFAQLCHVSLGQGVTFPNKVGLRIVLLLWMVFSLYLNIIYNSTFTSSLAKAQDEILLKSLNDLNKSKYPFGGPQIVESYLNDTDEQHIVDLRKRYQVMTTEKALDALYTNNMMTVLQRFTVDNINWIHRSNRSKRIYVLQDPVLRFSVFFFTRRGHPYRRSFRMVVLRAHETGLMSKWYKSSTIDEDKRLIQEAEDGILTMTNLRSIFELFLVCTGITFFTFVLELFYYNLQAVFQRLTSTSRVVPFACRKHDSSLP